MNHLITPRPHHQSETASPRPSLSLTSLLSLISLLPLLPLISLSLLLFLSPLPLHSQGLPFIRNFSAEEYHANNMNFDVETDENGNIFVANFEGLMYYNHAEWQILHTPGISRITVVIRASDNQIWVGGYNYFGKIVRQANGTIALQRIGSRDLFRGEVWEIFEQDGKLLFVVSNGVIYEVNNDQVNVYKEVGKKSLQMGMLDVMDTEALTRGEKEVVRNDTVQEEPLENGLSAIVRKNFGLLIRDDKTRSTYSITDENGICSNNLSYASYDGRGQLWVATGKGIFSVQVPSSFSRFTPHEGLTGSVLSIEEFNHRIYVGTDDGLFFLDGLRFKRVAGINYACWDLTGSGNSLLAATADGIFRLTADGRVSHLTNTTAMALLTDGDIIYCGETDGVYQMQASGQGHRRACNLENVRKLLKDNDGTIWAQSLYGTLWYRKPGSDGFSLYKTGKKSETMLTIVPTSGDAKVVSAETTEPFPYPLFSCIDNQGVTWLTNNEGKQLYRWKDGKRLHDLDYLLSPVQESSIRTLYTRENEIWLGDDNGLTIINTQMKDPALAIQPKLYIRSIRLSGDSILWGGFGQMPEVLPEIGHKENDLHITFSLDYTPIVGQTLYRYRLNNNNWSAWTTNTQANFVNLLYGDYVFSVQAKDAMNRTTEIVSVRFHVNPPFYYQWYMLLVYLLALLAIFYAIFRLRLRRLEKDKIRLERVVQDRTAEVVKQKDEIEEKSKRLETALQELGEAQDELIRQEKMATVGKLTQGLIDRILNPLNYINNFAKLSEGLVKDVKANIEDEKDQMSEDNYDDTMDVLDMLSGNLEKVGEHGQSTTRTLKAMEEMLKDRSGGIVDTELTAILRQNKEMVEKYYAKEMADHHIRLDFDIPDKDIPLQANPELLSKSIMSMYGNAIYALAKKAQRTAYQPELSTKVTTDGTTVTIVIRDNGIGIEDTIIKKIFDPFFTTKTTGEASGVGLYLSHEVIQNYGGDISVKSVKDEFCEFTITLPAKTK